MKATEPKSTHSQSHDTADQSSAEQAFFSESSLEQTPFFHPTAAPSLQTHSIPQGGTFFRPASVPTLQAKCAACEAEEQQQQEQPMVQFSLTIGQPGDPYEREADRVADQVMQISDQALEEKPENLVQPQPLINSILPLMRQSQGKAAQDKHQIRVKKLVGQTSSVTPTLESRLQSSKGQGHPLSEATRSFMEPRFRADFSQVRVHTDSSAVAMNQELRSQAFAQGSDVYFGAGTTPGKNALTAHELTHVLQQSDNRVQPRLRTEIQPKPRLLALDLTQSRPRAVSRKSAKSSIAITHIKSDVIQRLTQQERLSRGNDIYDLLEGWTSSADSTEILNKFSSLAKADIDQILNVIALRASSSVFDAYKWMHDDMVTSDWKVLMQRFIRVNSQDISEIIAYVVVSDYLEGYTSDEDSKQISEYLSIVPGTQLDAVLTAMETRAGKKFADMVDFLFGDMQATDAQALSLTFFGSGSTKAINYAAQWHSSKILDLLSGYTSVRDSRSILQNFQRIGGKADSPDTAAQIAVLTKLSELTLAKWGQTAQDALMKNMQQEDYIALQKMLPNNLGTYNLEKNFLEEAWDKIAIAYDYVEGFIEYGVCGIAGIVVGIFDAVKSIVGGIVDIAVAIKNVIGWLISKASGGRFARESEENVKNFFTSLGKALGAPLDLIGKMWDATKEEASLIEGPFEECKLSIFWIRKVANFIINILLLIFAGYGAVKASIEAIEAIKNISNFAELVAKVGKLPVALLRKIKSLPGTLARGGSRIINAIRNVDTIANNVRKTIGFIRLAAQDENFWLNVRRASGEFLDSKIQAEKEWWAKRKEAWNSSATAEEGKIAQSEQLGDAATTEAETNPASSELKAMQAEDQAVSSQAKTNTVEKEIKTGKTAEERVPNQPLGAISPEYEAWEKGLSPETRALLESNPELRRFWQEMDPDVRRALTYCNTPCIPEGVHEWPEVLTQIKSLQQRLRLPPDHRGLREYLHIYRNNRQELSNAIKALDSIKELKDFEAFLDNKLIAAIKDAYGVTVRRGVDGLWEYPRADGTVIREFEVGTHSYLTGNRGTNNFFQSHHGIQDAWARNRFSGLGVYSREDAPTLLLRTRNLEGGARGTPHNIISERQNARNLKRTFAEEGSELSRDLDIIGAPTKVKDEYLAQVGKYFKNLYSQLSSKLSQDELIAIFGDKNHLTKIFGSWP